MKNILNLWDIDGNMVNLYKCHNASYQKAIFEVYGKKIDFKEIESNYGVPSREVIAIPLRKIFLDEKTIQNGIKKALLIYSKQLGIEILKSDKSNLILPGVVNVLNKFKSFGIPSGIVTGNIKEAGELIIENTGLIKFFDSRINSFAEQQTTDRSQIVKNAIDLAIKNKIISKDAKIYVFGDTPTDVLAAKKNNCISIAVIKNSNDKDSSYGGQSYNKRKIALEEAGPHLLLEDYTQLDKLLDFMNLR